MKKIWIISLFPDFFASYFDSGVVGKFFAEGKLTLETLYLGDFSKKSFKGVDASPYGGGPGMVMRADVLKSAMDHIIEDGGYQSKDELHTIYTSPRGETLRNILAKDLGMISKDLVFICGRYEGVDERFIEEYVDQIISIGDFVLSGGELAVMTIIDSFIRFLPGALGNNSSALEDSFEDGLIEGPVYTRPSEFLGKNVPDVLLSGDHAKIKDYNHQKKLEFTKKYRPDLYKAYIDSDNR